MNVSSGGSRISQTGIANLKVEGTPTYYFDNVSQNYMKMNKFGPGVVRMRVACAC